MKMKQKDLKDTVYTKNSMQFFLKNARQEYTLIRCQD